MPSGAHSLKKLRGNVVPFNSSLKICKYLA